MMGWIDTVPLRLVRTIGVLEVLGALALILPPTDRHRTGPGHCGRHRARTDPGRRDLPVPQPGEVKVIGLNVALLALAGVEIWLATVWL